MSNLSKKDITTIQELVERNFLDLLEENTNIDGGEAARKIYKQLSRLYHPDKCARRDLPAALVRMAGTKKDICNELFKHLSFVYETHMEAGRMNSETGKPVYESWEDAAQATAESMGHRPFTFNQMPKGYNPYKKTSDYREGEKTRSDVFDDSIYDKAWACYLCGGVVNESYRSEFDRGGVRVCSGCGEFHRLGKRQPSLGEQKRQAAEKKAAARAAYKPDTRTFKAFKEFMWDVYGRRITKKNFSEYFTDPNYQDEFEDYLDEQAYGHEEEYLPSSSRVKQIGKGRK